jgi:hypothetical protein
MGQAYTFFTAGIISAICRVYLHVRHRVFNKRTPELSILLAFCASIACLMYGPALPVSSAAFLPTETVIRPISHLMYVRVTNRTSQPRRLAGIAIEVADKKSWWPSWLWEPSRWTRLCQVPLHDAPLIAAIDATHARKIGDGDNLENVIGDNPLSPFDTVSRMDGVGMPKWQGLPCKSHKNRIVRYRRRLIVADNRGAISSA